MITGKVTSIYGKDINTDDIIPASFLQQSNDRKFFKDYAFNRYDPAFRERCKQSTANIVIGGEKFACGSSRGKAGVGIQEKKAGCVVGAVYPCIFFCNSLRNGVGVFTLPRTAKFSVGGG